MPRRNTFRIEEFARIKEPATLLWLRNLRQDTNGDWRITAVLRGVATREPHPVELPFGLMPGLIPGTVFNQGRPGATPDIGQLDVATVPSLRHYELVSLRDVPASVFPTGQRWNQDQKLYRYRTPDMDLYVPPIELVRYLFLHDRVLANAILRRGAWPSFGRPCHRDITAILFFSSPLRCRSAFCRQGLWQISPGLRSTRKVSLPGTALYSRPTCGMVSGLSLRTSRTVACALSATSFPYAAMLDA